MPMIYVGATAAGVTALPDPKEFKVSLQDIDGEDAGRTADGTMTRDRVCGGSTAKRKLEIKWAVMRPSEASTLLQAISAEFFFVKYPDPYTGAFRTVKFYAGDRSVPMFMYGNGTTDLRWEEISVNFIEQ